MCKARISERERITSETSIKLRLNLDGAGKVDVQTGWGFFDHMLNLLFFWAGMDLQLHCEGDLHIDAHHSVEDVGLALGAAFHEALGDCIGIARVGYGRVPMDEALAEATVDLSGRPWLVWRGEELLPPLIGGQEKDLWREFYKSLCATGLFNLHIAFLYGKNGHHLLESCAKSLGCALGVAVKRCGHSIRSTKGVL